MFRDGEAQTVYTPWLSDYAKEAEVKAINSPTQTQLKNLLSAGCVAVVHDPGYSPNGHYMAILDINEDKTKIYISNPDINGSPIKNGWNPISVLYTNNQYLTDCYFVSNKGNVVDYSGEGASVASLDNFLFIGDSRTHFIETQLKDLGKDITAIGVSSSNPAHWKEVTKSGGPSTVRDESVTLPSNNKVNGVSVALGVNATNQVSEMKEVLNNLLKLYPNKPIFVNSVFYVGSGYKYGNSLNATKMNANIDDFNNQIKTFCNSKSNLIYVDVSSGLHSSSNALKSEYTGDNVHLNNKGNKVLVDNIKKAILSNSSDSTSGSSDSTCTGTESGKYYTTLKKTDGLNRIDFMNSNPDIFHRYIRDGAEYYEYVGYSRSKLKLSYYNLKKLFNEVYEKHGGSLPWAYGKTLGFDNIYTASKASSLSSKYNGIFTWPVPEYVEAGIPMKEQFSADFSGNDSVHNGNHSGVDITHTTNPSADIVAAAEGTVIVAENLTEVSTYPGGPRTYGNYVIIDHGNGYFTCYGHMQYNSITVKVGDKVNKGQKIGVMGTTGYSTGNHLHFEIRQGDSWNSGTPIDPSTFFNDDCSPVGGSGAAGQDVIDFVWTWEGSDDYLESLGYLSSDHKYYYIYIDYATKEHNRACGHGLDLDAGGFDEVFRKAGYSTSVGSKIPKEFADNLSKELISTRRSQIASKVSGLNLKDYQIDALVSRSYQMGPYGWYDGDTLGRYAPGETFISAYNKWWKDSDTKSQPDYNHPLYTNFMQYTTNGGDIGIIKRRKSEWKLFQTGVYDAAH